MNKLYDDLIKQLIEIGRSEEIPIISDSEFSYLRKLNIGFKRLITRQVSLSLINASTNSSSETLSVSMRFLWQLLHSMYLSDFLIKEP